MNTPCLVLVIYLLNIQNILLLPLDRYLFSVMNDDRYLAGGSKDNRVFSIIRNFLPNSGRILSALMEKRKIKIAPLGIEHLLIKIFFTDVLVVRSIMIHYLIG